MTATLHFDVEEQNGVRIIHVSGPLDSATYDQFKAFLDPMFHEHGVHIVLDCRGLTYVNSHGVVLLTQYQRMATLSASFFGIAAFRPYILKGIQRLGLGDLLTWYPTLDTAMEIAVAV